MLIKRFLLSAVSAVILALGIAGCGGGDDDLGSVASNNTGASAGAESATGSGTGTGQASDTFISRVMQIIGATADNAEPVATDSVTVTNPDNTEPVPIS